MVRTGQFWDRAKTYAWFAAAAWLLVLAVAAAQFFLSPGFEGDQGVRLTLREWLPWVVLAPAVAWLAGRFRFERRIWPSSLLIHAAACAAVIGICSVVSHALALRPPPRGGSFRHDWHLERRGWGGGRGPGSGMGMWLWELQRARVEAPIYCLIVAVMQAIAFSRRSQERERRAAELSASLAQARLQALHLQLQPHFLFNALNAISALVHKDARAADDMIANLSELLRLSLSLAEQPETTVKRELEMLACYLEIERARFGERLRAELNIDPNVMDAWLPALLLQPLVENAVRHGLQAQTGEAWVDVAVARKGDRLCVTVADRGRGLAEGEPAAEGVGLANTRARLRELYGEEGVLRIENAPGGGCRATVELPLHSKA